MQLGYWARLTEDAAADPMAFLGVASPEDAAGAFAQRLIEGSEGAWTCGAISVWSASQSVDDAIIYDITARFITSPDDENEIDCEVEIIERSLDGS